MTPLGRVCLSLLAATAALADGPEIGKPAPPLNLEQVLQAPAGAKSDWKDLRGKVVVLDFWATWCGPCIESIPHWNELAASLKDKPVHFVAITDENKDVVLPFLKKRPINSWIGLEGVAATKVAYDIRGIPTTILVNQTGTVVAVTHPTKLTRDHILEVVNTGRSSMPIRSRSSADEPEVERVPTTKPRFEISVRPSGPVPSGRGYNAWSTGNGEDKGEYADVRSAILHLFKVRGSQLDARTTLPAERHHFTLIVPDASREERESIYRAMFRSSFGLDVRREDVARDVFLLKKTSPAPGLNPSRAGKRGGGGAQLGGLNLDNGTLGWTTRYLESWLGRPVVDETGDTNRYDIRLQWKLSRAEQLLTSIDRKVLRAAAEPDPDYEKKLTPEQRREAAALRGELKDSELGSFSEKQREDIRIFRAEMAKPEDDRFAPDPQAILTAVKEQWGVELVPDRRTLPGLIVNSAGATANIDR